MGNNITDTLQSTVPANDASTDTPFSALGYVALLHAIYCGYSRNFGTCWKHGPVSNWRVIDQTNSN